MLENIAYKLNQRYHLNEHQVCQYVILPVLEALGWDTWSEEVVPQYKSARGIVDYALFIDGRPKVFIEAKNLGEFLSAHEEQLLRYAYTEGIELAVLTNGKEWWFYLPTERNIKWDDRKFVSLNILDNTSYAEEQFRKYISKDSVSSGYALKQARSTLLTKLYITEIWQDMISEPEELLVDLISEKLRQKINTDVDINIVREFLHNMSEGTFLQMEDINMHYYEVNENESKLKHTKPASVLKTKSKKFREFILVYKNKARKFRSMKDLVKTLLNTIEDENNGFLNVFYKKGRGKKRVFISRNPQELYGDRIDLSAKHKDILRGDWYIGTNYSVQNFIQMAQLACEIVNYNLKIEEQEPILCLIVS